MIIIPFGNEEIIRTQILFEKNDDETALEELIGSIVPFNRGDFPNPFSSPHHKHSPNAPQNGTIYLYTPEGMKEDIGVIQNEISTSISSRRYIPQQSLRYPPHINTHECDSIENLFGDALYHTLSIRDAINVVLAWTYEARL